MDGSDATLRESEGRRRRRLLVLGLFLLPVAVAGIALASLVGGFVSPDTVTVVTATSDGADDASGAGSAGGAAGGGGADGAAPGADGAGGGEGGEGGSGDADGGIVRVDGVADASGDGADGDGNEDAGGGAGTGGAGTDGDGDGSGDDDGAGGSGGGDGGTGGGTGETGGTGGGTGGGGTVGGASVPTAPTITSITRGDEQLTVAFLEPVDTGDIAIDNYEYSVDDGATWVARGPASTTSPLVITGLANGTTYPVRLRAVDDGGPRAPSGSMSGTPATVPSAPTITAVTSGDAELSVAFTAGGNGGSDVIGFEYQLGGDAAAPTGVTGSCIASCSFTISGLTNGTLYQVRVRAVNAVGAGALSVQMSGTPATVPSAPTITSLTEGVGQLSVAFTAGETGGSALTNYEYSTDDGGTWEPSTWDPAAPTSPLVITGLTSGTGYPVRIRAVNAVGVGAPSGMVPGMAAVPCAEGGSCAVGDTGPGGGLVFYVAPAGGTFSSAAPACTTGCRYLEALPASSTTYIWQTNNTSSRSTSTSLGTGYANTYTATDTDNPAASAARDLDAGGRSDWFLPSKDELNELCKFARGQVTGDTSVACADEGTILTGWLPRTWSSSQTSVGGAWIIQTSGVFTDAQKQTNDSSIHPVRAFTHDEPTITGVTSGDGTLTVAFTPGAAGASPITNYEYSTDGGLTWVARDPASTTSPLEITGLTNGTTYRVRIRAVDADGSRAPSGIAFGTPMTVASAPTITGVTRGDGQLTVDFDGPDDDGGSAIISYEYSTDGSTWVPRAPVSVDSPLVITGLDNGTTYDVRIRAVNSVGDGAASNIISGTPATVPSAPTIDELVPGDDRLTVEFTAGANGGSAIMTYQYSTDGGLTWVARDPASITSPLEITGLTNGIEYDVEIRAVNDVGEGAASTAVAGIPALPCAEGGACAVGDTGPGGGIVFYVEPAGGTFDAPGTTCGTACRYLEAAPAGWNGGGDDPSVPWSGETNPSEELPTGTAIGTGRQNTLLAVAQNDTAGRAITLADSYASTVDGVTYADWFLPSKDELNELYEERTTVGGLAVTDGTGTIYWSSSEYYDPGTGDYSPTGAWQQSFSGGLQTSYTVKADGSRVRPIRAFTHADPVITGITADDEELTVAFIPGDDSGTVTGYEYSTDDGATWRARETGTTGSPLVITTISGPGATALVNGVTYAVRIRPVDADGPRPRSDMVAGTPETVPSAPGITSITSDDVQLTVTFTVPESDGGREIATYEYSTDGGDTWRDRTDGATGTSLVITTTSADPVGTVLVNGTEYTVAIRAVNSVGPSDASDTMSATPETVPYPPTITGVTPDDGQLEVAFTPPHDGGREITTYEYSTDDGVTWRGRTDDATGSPLVITMISEPEDTGLVNDTTYQVRIRAISELGAGAASDMVEGTPAIPCAAGGVCAVGDIGPGGGYVFSVASDGLSGREAAPQYWHGPTSWDPGFDYSNAVATVNSLTIGGLSDWELPRSTDPLLLFGDLLPGAIYWTSDSQGTGDFCGGTNVTTRIGIDSSTGSLSNYCPTGTPEEDTLSVRPVRAFDHG